MAPGHVTTYNTYDPAGRITQQTDPTGLVTAYQYDPRGRVITQTQTPPSDTARVTHYTYTAAGQLDTVRFPDGITLTYTYDAAQQLRVITDNIGNQQTYTYDLKGNRTHEQLRDAGGQVVRDVQTTYDLRNRIQQLTAALDATQSSLTQTVYDAVGNLLQETAPNHVATNSNVHTQHQYDALNRLFHTTDRLNGITHYGYDTADRITQIKAPNQATVNSSRKLTHFTHDLAVE